MLSVSNLYAERLFAGMFFRKASESEKIFGEAQPEIEETIDFRRIRCPHCRWQPTASSRWYCGDCPFPEFFFGGCGTGWNTFATGGRCPGCLHQWKWTLCLRCNCWARHEEWYETAGD